MTPQAIAKYEQEGAEPTWPVVLRLAAALGVSTEEFRVTDDSPPEAEPEPDPPGRRQRK